MQQASGLETVIDKIKRITTQWLNAYPFYERKLDKEVRKVVQEFEKEVLAELIDFEKAYDIKPKPEEWEESVGEAFQKMHDEINRKLKFHGIFQTENMIIIDQKQNKFVVVDKKQLREGALFEKLAEMEHEQWAHWIGYQHSLRKNTVNYVYAQKWKEWLKLAQTPYNQLSEKQKETDREFARKVVKNLLNNISPKV